MRSRLVVAPTLGLTMTLVGCSVFSAPLMPTFAESTPQASPAAQPDGIGWAAAREHLGEVATVCGPVISTFTAASSVGSPTFLNVGVDYPDPAGLTVIIFDDYRSAFPFDPAIEYQGDTVCVTGEIRAHGEFVQIEARSPDQITVRG